MSDNEHNLYNGGHRWDNFDDPWHVPTTEYPNPGGAGTPAPWSHGDQFRPGPHVTDPQAQMFQDGVNDAVWRAEHERALWQSHQGDPSQYAPTSQMGDVVDGIGALRRDLASSEGTFMPDLTNDPRLRVMRTPPQHSPLTPVQDYEQGATFWSPVPVEPVTREESEYYTPPRTKGLWLSILGVGVVVAGAAALNVASSERSQNDVATQSGRADASFSCDVSGISEDAKTGNATLQFRQSVAGKNIQVFAVNESDIPVAMQNAVAVQSSPTEYHFPANGMHNQRLVIKAGTAVCTGEVNLGNKGSGDESFAR